MTLKKRRLILNLDLMIGNAAAVKNAKPLISMVPAKRFELPTY